MPTTLRFVVGISRFQRHILAAVIAMLLASALAPAVTAAQTNSEVGGSQEGSITVISTSTIVETEDGQTPGGEVPDAPDDTNRFEGITEFPWTCTFFVGTTLDSLAVTTTTPRDGAFYNLRCEPNPGFPGVAFSDPGYQYIAANPFPSVPGLITSIDVREVAEDLVVPTTLTPGLSPDGRQITGVDTWFWPEGDTDTVTESATAGGLTVTVEARYAQTTFTVDGDSFTCTDYVEWTPGATESPCTYSFLEESPGQTITAASQWDFYWFDNASQPTPVLYASVTNTEVDVVEVIDLEAVISNN